MYASYIETLIAPEAKVSIMVKVIFKKSQGLYVCTHNYISASCACTKSN